MTYGFKEHFRAIGLERVSLIDSLNKEEQKTIFTILDAFISKRKFKSTLKTVLNDID